MNFNKYLSAEAILSNMFHVSFDKGSNLKQLYLPQQEANYFLRQNVNSKLQQTIFPTDCSKAVPLLQLVFVRPFLAFVLSLFAPHLSFFQ